MTLFALAVVALGQSFVQPPMHRAWTALTGDNTKICDIQGTTLYFVAQKQVGAVDIGTGKYLWRKKITWGNGGAVSSGRLYVRAQELKRTQILVFDMKTGSVRTLIQLPAETGEIACDAKHVFVILPNCAVAALDPTTGKTLWKTDLSGGKKGRGVLLSSLTVGGGRLFAAIEGPGFHCMDPATGKVIWKDNAPYKAYDPPLITPNGFVTAIKNVRLHDYKTGKTLWTYKSDFFQFNTVAAGVLVGQDNGRLMGLDLKTGRQLWGDPPSGDGSIRIGGRDTLSPGNANGVLVDGETIRYISPKDGKAIWSKSPDLSGSPVYADKTRVICTESERLFCYEHGAPAALPTTEEARKALALKMVSDFELLDREEIKQVAKLKPYATAPLIEKYKEWALANGVEDGLADREGRGQMLYGLLSGTAPLLDEMCTADDTEALVKALQAIGKDNSYRDELLTILGHRGDPDRVVPMYVEDLRANPPKPNSYWRGGAALEAVGKSRHPEAVKFMIEALEDPKAPSVWRTMAFVHLAGTGGEAGIAAVRNARATRKPRAPWETVLAKEVVDKRNIVAEKADARGRTWRLVRGWLLGNHSDLFIQEKTPSGWGKPVFIGLFTDRTWTLPAPTQFRGIPVKKFLDTEWIKILPDDAAIRTDSDGDGLTDLVEERFGTDPKKPDTDADGLNDSEDPCPNAAPRELSDREKIVAACVEARFFGEGWDAPGVIDVEGMKPFEMYGYDGVLLWGADKSGTVPKMYNTGVNMLSFPGRSEEEAKSKEWVTISADGKSAVTLISRYSGGLNGDGMQAKLIKVGDDWFVTELTTLYVS